MGLLTNFYGFKGYMQFARNNKAAAKVTLEKAYDKGLAKPSYLTAYGALLMQDGEFQKCKEVYERAMDGLGVNVMYYTAIKSSIVTCDYKLGNVEQATRDAEELYNDMKSTTACVLYGYILLDQGDLEKALQVNLASYEYDEDDVAICDNLGQTYYRLGDYENAEKYFREAIAIKRGMIDSCYFLSLMLLERGGDLNEIYELLDDAMDSNFSALTTVTKDELKAKYEEVKRLIELKENQAE